MFNLIASKLVIRVYTDYLDAPDTVCRLVVSTVYVGEATEERASSVTITYAVIPVTFTIPFKSFSLFISISFVCYTPIISDFWGLVNTYFY